MKVLLRTDVDGVGKRGDIIDVAGGFARNHLLPAGKAIVASDGVESQALAMRRSRDLRDARDREGSETVAKTLVGNTVTIAARASNDRLFGSVSAADIVRHVEEQTGAVIDRHNLVLEEPIKTVGEHSVRVELVGGVVFELTVDVVAEDYAVPAVPGGSPPAGARGRSTTASHPHVHHGDMRSAPDASTDVRAVPRMGSVLHGPSTGPGAAFPRKMSYRSTGPPGQG